MPTDKKGRERLARMGAKRRSGLSSFRIRTKQKGRKGRGRGAKVPLFIFVFKQKASTMPRAKGGKNWSKEELKSFLTYTLKVVPCGPEEWNDICEHHMDLWPDRNRSVESLRGKYTRLYRQKARTGSPGMTWQVETARKIFRAINNKMDMGNCTEVFDPEKGYLVLVKTKEKKKQQKKKQKPKETGEPKEPSEPSDTDDTESSDDDDDSLLQDDMVLQDDSLSDIEQTLVSSVAPSKRSYVRNNQQELYERLDKYEERDQQRDAIQQQMLQAIQNLNSSIQRMQESPPKKAKLAVTEPAVTGMDEGVKQGFEIQHASI